MTPSRRRTLPASVRAAAVLGLVAGLLAAPGSGQEIQFRPMEPDPINSPMLRVTPPRVEIPGTRILPLETPAAAASPATAAGSGQFVVVNRELGRLVVRRGREVRTFKPGPLGPPVPPEVVVGQRVEVRFGPGDVLQGVRILP